MSGDESAAAGARNATTQRGGDELSGLEAVVSLVLFALVAVLLRGYSIVEYQSDSVSQIPLVLRAADPAYLAGDWFVNLQSASPTRYAFAQIMGALTRVIGIEAAYFAAHLVAVLMTALVTYGVVVKALGGGRLAGLIAAVLVLAVELVDYGAVIRVILPSFAPLSLAQPLVLLAIGLALARRPVWCALAAGAASAFQPLVGIVPGALALGALAAAALLDQEAGRWPRLAVDRRRFAQALTGMAALAPFALFWALVQRNDAPGDEFIRILAHVRDPHHWLPSSWDPVVHGWMVLLLLALGSLFVAWRRRFAAEGDGFRARFVVILAAALVALCGLGYLFVEVVPLKLVAMLMPCRYLYLVVWLALLITGLVGERVLRAGGTGARLTRGGWLLAGNGGAYAPMLLVAGLVLLRRETPARIRPWARIAAPALAWVAIAALLLRFAPGGLAALSLTGFALLAWLAGARRGAARLLVAALPLALFVVLAALNARERLPAIGAALDRAAVLDITFDRVEDRAWAEGGELAGAIEVARFARAALPADAVVLTPPAFGVFRVFAQRAIVVDFKSWPFARPGEWHRRLTDAYPNQGVAKGWELVEEMDRRWRAVDDRHVARVAARYGARYAVLHRATETALPTLFTGEQFKLVEVGGE